MNGNLSKNIWYGSLVTAMLLFNGCSDSGGSSNSDTGTDTTSSSYGGGAIDGYLQNATVFVDTIADGEHNSTEQSVITDVNGDFTLTGPIADGTKVYAYGGIDLSTGYPFEGRLSTRFDADRQPVILSPLTTFVAAVMDADPTADFESASTVVASNLGIDPADVNIDPMTQPDIFLASQKVQKTVEVIAAATGDEDFNGAYEDVFASLATVTVADPSSDFNATVIVEQVQVDSGDAINSSVATAVSDFLETYTATVDEIAAASVAVDDLNTYGEVLNTYTEVVEGALEDDASAGDIVAAVEETTTTLDDVNTTKVVEEVSAGSYVDPLVVALAEVEGALDNNISYLGTNTADDNITANLELTDPTLSPFDTADLNLTWSRSNTAVISASGGITPSDTVDIAVQLKATVNNGLVTNNRTFDLVVKRTEHAPVAVADTLTLDEDSTAATLNALANDTDLNGDTLSVTAVSTPVNGTATVVDGNISYVPNANFNGSDLFTYTVADATGYTATATVTVTVNAIADTTVWNTPATLSDVVEDFPEYTVELNATDVDGAVTYALVSTTGIVTADVTGSTLTITSVANLSGSETIIVSATEGGATTNHSIALIVQPTNDTTVWNTPATLSDVPEDFTEYTVELNATDVDGTVVYNLVSTTGVVTANVNGSTLTITPIADISGLETITVSATEGAVTTEHSIALTVTAVNDVPTAASVAAGVFQTKTNVELSGDLNSYADDIDGDALTFAQVGTLTGLTLESDGTFTFTSSTEADYSFTYTVSDGTDTSAEATVAIGVVAYISPVAADISDSTDEDTSSSIDLAANITAGDADVDLTTLAAFGATKGTVSVNPVSGEATYTPTLNENGSDSFTYTVEDTVGNISNSGTVTVTINAVDDAPALASIADVSVNVSGTKTVTVSAIDVESDLITYSAVSTSAAVAAVSVSGATITVEPAAIGTTTVTVTADANSLTDTKTFTVTVVEDPVGDDTVWFDGKSFNGFWMDSHDGETMIAYDEISLSSGTIISTKYVYDMSNSVWIEDISSGDSNMNLNMSTGAWESDTVETYEINSSDNTIMRLDGREDIKIDSLTSLDGSTMNITNEDGSITIPVTYTTGALKYNISWKLLVDHYRLEWMPTLWDENGDTGVGYASLEEYIHSNGHFYYDESTGTGVQAQRNVDGNVSIYSDGSEVSVLALGETGKLVTMDYSEYPAIETVVGTWTVVTLPNQSVLTLDAVLDPATPNYDNYMQHGKMFATTYEGYVRMVEFEAATADFVADDDEDFMVNAQAMADIDAAIALVDFSVFNIAGYFESGTKYFVNEDGLTGERTFDGAGNYTGVINNTTGDLSVAGTYAVDANNIMTLTRTSPASATLLFEYVGETEFNAGQTFSLIFNGGDPIETYNFSSISERDDAIVNATQFMHDFFAGTTKYYFNENGSTGDRTFTAAVDGSIPYTGTYTGNVSGAAVDGNYSIVGSTMTLNRTGGAVLVFEHMGDSTDFNVNTFSLSINGGEAITTTNYASQFDRDAAAAAATQFMYDFFVDTTKYYLNETGATGDRTFSTSADGSAPYTGTYTGIVAGNPVDGSYSIVGSTMTLDRTGGTVLVFEHMGDSTDLGVNTFSLSINGGDAIITTNYAAEIDRDNAASALAWSSELGSPTEEEFINLGNTLTASVVNTWWFIDDAINMEEISINGDGTIDVTETIDNVLQTTETLFYTIDNNSSLGGDFVGLQETNGGAYMEYLKFYEDINSSELQTLYPNITFSVDAAAIKVAAISAGESFDPWTDAGDFATVGYTNFTDMIAVMTHGVSDTSSDEVFIIGNGADVVLFESSTNNIVFSNGTYAGTYEIRDIDGTSTLVVYITEDPSFDEHIAFQFNGTDISRGDIYDRWSDIWLNTTAKEDVVTYLNQ